MATGVLLGLWISVRNSARQDIDPEKAWNLGILVVALRDYRFQGSIRRLRLEQLSALDGYFQYQHAAGWGRVFRRIDCGSGGGRVVHPAKSHAGASDLRRVCARAGAGTRNWSRGMLCGRVLFREANACVVGRDVHESGWRTGFGGPPLNERTRNRRTVLESAVELANFFLLMFGC